jgi:hypothetical protein
MNGGESRGGGRSRSPWLIGCTVLLALFTGAVVVGAVLFGRSYALRDDRAYQLGKLAEVLPHDALSAAYDPHGYKVPFVPVRLWRFVDWSPGEGIAPLEVAIVHARGKLAAELRKDLDGELTRQAAAQKGTFLLQGRSLPVYRVVFQQAEEPAGEPAQPSPESAGEGSPEVAVGPFETRGNLVLLDLGAPAEGEALVVAFTRKNVTEPISDETLLRFFEPFHVGSERKETKP